MAWSSQKKFSNSGTPPWFLTLQLGIPVHYQLMLHLGFLLTYTCQWPVKCWTGLSGAKINSTICSFSPIGQQLWDSKFIFCFISLSLLLHSTLLGTDFVFQYARYYIYTDTWNNHHLYGNHILPSLTAGPHPLEEQWLRPGECLRQADFTPWTALVSMAVWQHPWGLSLCRC